MSLTALDPAAYSDGNAKGAVSSSTNEATCAFPGCTSHAIPDSSFCGDERHTSSTASQTDGTVSPQDDQLAGYEDGTGRSQKQQHQHPLGRHPRTGKPRKQNHLHRAIHHGELRADNAPEAGHVYVSGTAIVYDVRTVIHDSFGAFGETIAQGAAGGLLDGDIRLLTNHDGLPLARTTSKSLWLQQDKQGVHFSAELDVEGSPLAANVVSGIRRGDLSGCSFAFTVNDAGDHWNNDMTERTIKRFASIPEISIVTFPAYPTTTVAARQRASDLHRKQLIARRAQIERRRPALRH